MGLQRYKQAEEHYRQLEQMNVSEARWPVMVAACLHTQGLNMQVITLLRLGPPTQP